jgi:hypothetical protein
MPSRTYKIGTPKNRRISLSTLKIRTTLHKVLPLWNLHHLRVRLGQFCMLWWGCLLSALPHFLLTSANNLGGSEENLRPHSSFGLCCIHQYIFQFQQVSQVSTLDANAEDGSSVKEPLQSCRPPAELCISLRQEPGGVQAPDPMAPPETLQARTVK